MNGREGRSRSDELPAAFSEEMLDPDSNPVIGKMDRAQEIESETTLQHDEALLLTKRGEERVEQVKADPLERIAVALERIVELIEDQVKRDLASL